MKISRSILCVILSLILVTSMMPSYMFSAYAENEPVASEQQDTTEAGLDGQPSGEESVNTAGETQAPVEEKGQVEEPAAVSPNGEDVVGNENGIEESPATSEQEAEKEAADTSSEMQSAGNEAGNKADNEDNDQAASGSEEENSETVEKTVEAAEEAKEETDETDDESAAGYASNGGVEGIDVSGPAADDEAKAAEILTEMTSLSNKKAAKMAAELFGATDENAEAETEEAAKEAEEAGETYPSHGDGSNIDVMTAEWITADTVDNGDKALLYVKSNGSTDQQVRLRINYALSGEHSYNPYDISISFPAKIFRTRDGKPTGRIIIPYPEDPSKKQDFNWKQVGDNIVITNTKRMSAATKGYIEIAFDGLDPALIKDMGVSDDFVATIEVTTFKDNTLSLSTEPLVAQFDTEARLTDVNKRNISVTRVKASQIPENQRVEGEESYIKVDWYVWGATNANTYYTIDQVDYIPQAAPVQQKTVVEDGEVKDPAKQISVTDAQKYKEGAATGDVVTTMTEADIKGFVLGADSADKTELEKSGAYYGRRDGRGSDYSFSTVYPASQFKKDTNYTFNNTIRYTVTEKDGEVTDNTNPNVQEVDPQLVTTDKESAKVTWSFTDPKWVNPGGHYMVHKNGNDDNNPESSNVTHKSIYTYSDLHRNDDGYYGIYPSAINDLQKAYEKKGEDGSVRLSYTINTIGYTLPWMYDGGVAEFKEGEIPARIIGNYNRPITMTTTDTGVSFGRNGTKLSVGTDYTYEEIEFPGEPYVYKGNPQNINADGTWEALDAGDGTFKYTRDTNKANWPDIKLQLQIDGEWQDWATVSWKTGNRVITLRSGERILNSGVVKVPEETQNFRTVVTTRNTAGGEGATEAIQAGIQYDVRPVINLKSTKALMERFDGMFAQSNTPSMSVYNSTNMLIEREDVSIRDAERVIHSIDRDGYDSIRGYTTDTSVYPYKEATQNLREVDYENRVILIHYKARVEEHSVISDRKTWQEAVNEGNLQSENSCTWYDLLPKGVAPKISTIKLRKGDSLISADTYENYQNTGRTLLVVKAKLTPVPETYRSGDMTYYMDVPTISFDATYDFESWKDYGSDIHNVVAFESGNDSLGSIPKYIGEPDDPRSSNNVSTRFACVNEEERRAMTDLNGDNVSGDGAPNTFVYAGVTTRVDLLAAARTSLYKDVEVNNDNIWNEGTYYTPKEEAREATEGGNKRTVFEGGQYTYRLRVMSDPDTISAGMIIYDALEDFEAKASDDGGEADNDEIDIEAVKEGAVWKGTLREVDVSQLEELGCAPVVYYSTKVRNYNRAEDEEYALTKGIKDDTPNKNIIDLSNTDVWVKASDYNGDKSEITAIAIDCTKTKDGKPFKLNPLESAVVLVRMKAPSGNTARELIAMTGRWGDSAQAYNNAFLYAASFKKDQYTGEVTEDDMDFIRKDYTKVGLKEYSLTVDKTWDDDNNRDGKRPETITFELYANGKPMQPVRKQTLNLADGKSVTFEHIPYTDYDGEKIHYTVVEEPVAGYTADYNVDQHDAQLFHVLNTHEPERTQVSGEKTWDGDEDYQSARPSSIDVELYGNGKKLKTQTVKVDQDGKWSYEFINLYKYENGKEITYTVKEVKTPGTDNKADSYVPEYNDDNADIKNTYHPFGEILVSKTVENTTEVSKNKEFTFTFSFTKTGEDGTETPVFDEFDYEILDADGNSVMNESGEPLKGKVGTNGTVKIKGGQKIHVVEIPEMLSYKVTEEAENGFTLVGKSGDSGQIDPNKAAEVTYTNRYAANGLINLEAIKKLTGRKINKNQFLFELYEVTTDEEGKEVEIAKPSATNDAASDVKEEDGTVVSSEAPVTFGGIRYTQKDHGKTFTYRIKEVDRGKAGYTYSEDVFEAKVTVADNGDGTLTITPVYTDKDGNEVEKPVFTNKYEAKGSAKLQAWKDLPGRNLTDGEFEFELLDEKGEPVVNSKKPDADDGEGTIEDADQGKDDASAGSTDDQEAEAEKGEPVTATNKADGTVTFDPAEIEELNYTQEDIGKTFYYAIREKEGGDDSVTYDKAVYGYEVKIVDNGDGTLFAEQSLATPVFDEKDPAKIVRWTTEGAVLPVFKNGLEPGSLSVQKVVDQPTEGDLSTPFKFKVRLTGEKLPEGEMGYTITEATEVKDKDNASGADSGNGSNEKVNIEAGEFEFEIYAGEKATFDGIPAGTAYQVYEETPAGWVLVETVNASGIIEATKTAEASFKNEYAPGSASAQFYATKTLDGRAAEAGAFSFELKDSKGNVIQTKPTTDGGFVQFDPIKYDKEGTYTYTITEVVPTGDTIDYDTHAAQVTVEVKADGDELTAEVKYDDEDIRFANTTKPGNLKLTKKTDITTDANKDDEFTFRIRFNNANGQPIGKDSKIYWFTEPAEATESAKTNNEDSGTPKRSLMSRLSSLFRTGKVTQEAEITGNNYRKGQSIEAAPSEASAEAQSSDNVQSKTTSSSNISFRSSSDPLIITAYAANDIAGGTFRGVDWRITSDGTLIIGNGGTQTLNGNGNKDNPSAWPWYSYRTQIKSVKFDGTVKMTGSAAGMFKNASNLTTFDSTGFDPSTANNFCHMFYGCSKLTSVDARGWVTSRVRNIDGMFMNCSALKKVVTSEWDVSSVVTIYQLFENCYNLEEVDTSSWKTYKADAFHWMNDIFSDCHKLKDVDTSGWVIQDTIEGWQWFNNDYKIRRLDLTGVTRPTNAQYQSNCFVNMNSLSVFKVGSKTFNNNVARFQPGTWKNLATGATYDGDWLNRNWKTTMAGTYVRLTATFYKNGEMIIDWGYDESRNSEVDEVFILSNNTGATPPWDSYAGKSKVTKVTINTEITPASTAKWFNGMSSLKKIEGLDNLKMTNLTNMQNMFAGCTSLDSIYLPENFSFKGKNITNTYQQAVLPTPPSTDGFIGKWVRDDGAYGTLEPTALRDQFTASMAGTWVWAVDDSIAMVTYYGNGGFPEAARYKTADPTETITMPNNREVTRPHYILTGWNTKEDGSGSNYDPGATVDGFLKLGQHKVLYAQWAKTDLCSYKVEHYQQKADGSGYNLVDTDRPELVIAGTEVTPEVKSYPGFLSPEPQTATVLDDSSLVVKYYYDKLSYKVHFDGNGETSGSMVDQNIQGGTQTPLSKNQFKKEGYLFTGWTTEADGSGKYYVDQQKVRDLTKTDGATVTLYAKWLSKDDAELEPTNGEIIVKCKAGETIVIPDLPAGTTYTIEEIGSPDGWTQSGEIEGNDEAIAANATKYATANNTYVAEGEAQIRAHKKLEGDVVKPGQFTFELYKDAELTDRVETKTNGTVDNNEQATDGQSGSNPYYQTAEVEFTPIELTQDDIGKTLTYYIRETGKDEAEAEGITIDETVYKVDISVEDAGSGILTADVKYTEVGGSAVSGEPIFVNTMQPASLKINKTIVNATDSVKDAEFTFTVELTDAEGNALDGVYNVKIGDDESRIRSGGTLKLKGGESAVISGLPHGATYAVTEKERKNWDQTDKSGDTGMLRPGKTSEAKFTNTYVPPANYESEGSAEFKAVKVVEGGALTDKDGFTFELTDQRGNVLQTKGPDKVSSDDETVYSSDITFDAIHYTIDDLPYPTDAVDQYVDSKLKASFEAKDKLYEEAKAIFDANKGNKDKEFTYDDFFSIMHGNKMKSYLDKLTAEAEKSALRKADFIYYVKEVAGDDPDVTYDKQQYYFKVHAVDSGKGVIETTVTKWKPGVKTDPETGEAVIDEDTGEPVIEDKQIEDGDITFTNKKSTQIRVTKRWTDNNNVDGYRPSIEEFSQKIHLMNGETEVTGYKPEIKDDGKDSWTIVYTGLPAYDEDGNKITYTVREDEITNYIARDDKTEAADGETLLNIHAPDTVELRIAKQLDGYYNGGADSNVSVGFNIVAYDKADYEAGVKNEIWKTFAALTFKKGEGLSKTIVVSNVPKQAVLEVTEVYAGNYTAKDGKTTLAAQYDETENIWTVTFENTHKDTPHIGSGVVNKYVGGNISEQQGLITDGSSGSEKE